MSEKKLNKKAKKKSQSFFGEFKEFALKGNIVDLAVGVIIGGAFQSIVKSLVDDIIMPLIGLLIGSMDYSDLFVIIGQSPEGVDSATLATLEGAKAAGAKVFAYGSFISAVVNFIMMALAIFMLVKVLNKMRRTVTKKTQPEQDENEQAAEEKESGV